VVATLLAVVDRFAWGARTTMQVRTLDYVSAAWCAGASTRHILMKRFCRTSRAISPWWRRSNGARDPARSRRSRSSGSAAAPLPSWGLMIAEGKDTCSSPWVIFIGAALFTLVLGINLVGVRLAQPARTERLR